MDFDPDKFLAEPLPSTEADSFDPDAFLAAPVEEAPESSVGDAIGTGLAQGVTLGFSDELGGLKDAVLDGKDYVQARDARRAANAKVSEESPWITGAAEVVGSLPTMLVPGLNVAKGAGLAAKVGAGALAGGAMGFGKSNADLTKGDVGGAVLDTAVGAGVGGASAYAVDKVVSKAEKLKAYLGRKLREGALNSTEKHLRFTPSMKRSLGEEKMQAAASEVLDTGVMKPFSTIQDTSEAIGDRLNLIGRMKEDMVNASDGSIDPIALAQRIEDEVIAPLRGTAANRETVAMLEAEKAAILNQYAPNGPARPGVPAVTRPKVETQIADVTQPTPDGLFTQPAKEMRVYSMGEEVVTPAVPEVLAPAPLTPGQVAAEKIATGKKINWKTESNATIDAKRGVYGVLKDAEEAAVSDPRFPAIKTQYHNLANAGAAAERTGSLTDGGGLMAHITDVGIGTSAIQGLMNGNPAGAAVGVVRGMTKGRVASTAAVGMNELSKILKASPHLFGKYTQQLEGAAARGTLPVLHHLLQQRDPQYRETIQKINQK